MHDGATALDGRCQPLMWVKGQLLAMIRGWGGRWYPADSVRIEVAGCQLSREGAGPMKERLQCLLSEVGESFDYLRSDVRNLGRYLAELEELIEGTALSPRTRPSRRRLIRLPGANF